MQWMVRCEVDGTVCILKTVPSLSEMAGGPRAKHRDEGRRRYLMYKSSLPILSMERPDRFSDGLSWKWTTERMQQPHQRLFERTSTPTILCFGTSLMDLRC